MDGFRPTERGVGGSVIAPDTATTNRKSAAFWSPH
jgi:hypothetical protein